MHMESVGKVANEMIYSIRSLSVFRIFFLFCFFFLSAKNQLDKKKFAHKKLLSKCKRERLKAASLFWLYEKRGDAENPFNIMCSYIYFIKFFPIIAKCHCVTYVKFDVSRQQDTVYEMHTGT